MLVVFQCGTCTGKGRAVLFAADLGTTSCPACGSLSITSAVPQNIAPKASPGPAERSNASLPPVAPGELNLQVFKRRDNGQFEACGEFGLVDDNQIGPALLGQFGAGDFHVRWFHHIDGIVRSETIDLGAAPLEPPVAPELEEILPGEVPASQQQRAAQIDLALAEAGHQSNLLHQIAGDLHQVLELLLEQRAIDRAAATPPPTNNAPTPDGP